MRFHSLGAARLSPLLMCSFVISGQNPPPASAPDFARDIQPVLQQRCSGCHGERQQMGGLRLDDGASVLRGGYSGPVIEPGKNSASKLVARITSDKPGFQMPPGGKRLTAEQIAAIRSWIDAGAKVPASAGSAKAAGPAKSAHWSFQPVRRPNTPEVHNRTWARSDIDRFVLARLERENLQPSPAAGRSTLIRRVSLDLTGLPPTPAEVDAFVNDNRPDAYERVVDRLLASPHYGEKWGRFWLDLAHYADSDGYEKDLVRPYAWRYRNWVIDALNRDMPFDEFTIEQLAGDLLPNAATEQRVATGFLRNTLTNREAGVDRAEARFEQVLNRTNTIGTVWLGLTVGCAQCHNHKFDPISQKEFYQMFAFVNSVEEQDIDAPLPGEAGPYLRARPEYDRKRREILEAHHIPDMQAGWEARIREAFQNPGKDLEWDFQVTAFRASFDGADKFLKGLWTKRTVRQAERLTDYFVSQPGPDAGKDKEKTAALKETAEKLKALKETLPDWTLAPVIAEDPQAGKTNIHLGGDYQALGVEVQPGTLAVLPPLPAGEKPTRLTLARWIASRDNPLTARVAVNRMWQEFFGRGLVRTSEDFGTQGEKPSHPELLDWLASEFVERGWSSKQLQKEIVMSAVYRQSSHTRKDLETRDPENVLLARQGRMRLPAELVRDETLAASGLLNPAIGGKSVRPPQPAGVAELGYANNVKWKESTGADRYRRGMYIHFQRTTPYPMLMNFDAPDSNTACTRRRRSNTPLQALNLLNDPVFFEAAQGLAERLLTEVNGSQEDRLDAGFRLCLGRKPSARERERLSQYLDSEKQLLAKDSKAVEALLPAPPEGVDRTEAAAWVGLSRVLLNLDEFITRE